MAFSRRLLLACVGLGLFLLLDLSLFGWVIFRSLSQREIEQVLLETRTDAEDLAGQLAGRASHDSRDLYTLVAREREILTSIDAVLQKRDVVQTVEIRDRDGLLVYRSRTDAQFMPEGERQVGSIEVPQEMETQTIERESTQDLTVPIGEIGFVHIGISQGELQRRIGVLRSELVRQTSVIGAVTLTLLVLAYAIIYWVWKRGKRLESQAEEAERMAYIGTLASGLAHEIRNPLNSLNLNMQMLEEDLGPDETSESPRRRLLSITRSEIGRLEHLVTDFLSYARPRPLELEPVRAAALLERCREILGAQLQASGARVVVEDRSAGAEIRVDHGQMSQLLMNLIQNALAAGLDTGRRPEVRLVVEERGDLVAISVKDNGPGISPAEQRKIFDLFYSTRKGGTGLGLAIAQRIARAHGTELAVSSAEGFGTTLRLELPLAGHAVATKAGEGTAAAAAHPLRS